MAYYLLFFLFSTEHFLQKYNGLLTVATVVWSLVPCHSFDSDSRSHKYSADFLWALGSLYRSQAHLIGYQSVLV